MCKECHIVCVETVLKDREAIQAACKRRGLPLPVQGKASLFSGEFEGLLLQLPDWHYPAVIDSAKAPWRLPTSRGPPVPCTPLPSSPPSANAASLWPRGCMRII
jgi:hypothetical protein